jgi:hypothetical protein
MVAGEGRELRAAGPFQLVKAHCEHPREPGALTNKARHAILRTHRNGVPPREDWEAWNGLDEGMIVVERRTHRSGSPLEAGPAG